MSKLLKEVEAKFAANPNAKLEKLFEVLREINSKTLTQEQTLAIYKVFDKVRENLEKANMTYMAGAPPSPDTIEKDTMRWKNLPALLSQFPIIWIIVKDDEVVNVMFASIDMRDTWSLFHDHFTLTNSPPMSSPRYSKGQWVLYDMQNHVQYPNILLNYVPVEYAGHELLVFIEERADWK
jgi:hypothetical protein